MINVGRAVLAALAIHIGLDAQTSPAWQEWSASDAQRIAKSTVATGRIAGGRRLLNTERARSYKLRATWLTPEVVQASARLLQIRSRMSTPQVDALVEEVLDPGETAVMIEIDPNEGSGVIPLDWEAFLQPRDDPQRVVAGKKEPRLGDAKFLVDGFPRNYDYDRFWVVFRLKDPSGRPLFEKDDDEAELIVRVYDREGRIRWPIGSSIRRE